MPRSETLRWPLRRSLLPAGRLGDPGQLWMIAAALAAVAFFWSGLASLTAAWGTPEYSHGPVVPLVSLFLFLREMRDVPPAAGPVTDRAPGLALIALGLLVGALGNLARIDDITTYGFVIWVGGVVLVAFGLRRGFAFWPSVLHLIFMLPLPQFVYWHVSVQLQLVSSHLGVALIRLADVPVFLDGNVIDLGIYKLQVAEACSGLSYLFPMLSFTYTFAVLYRGPAWQKVAMLLMAVPITVVLNAARIGVIGIMVRTHGVGYAEGFLHLFEGWAVFVVCMVVLVGVAALLQRLTPVPKPLGEALDLDFAGVGAQLRRVAHIPATRPLMLAVAVTAAAAAAAHLSPRVERPELAREALGAMPQIVDGRSARWSAFDRDIERVLGADDYVSATYLDAGAGAPIDLFAAFYRSQTEGEGIHSPMVCLPTGGWEVSDWRRELVALPDGGVVPVNRALIRKGAARQLVYFWFEQRGVRLTSDYEVKARAVIDTVIEGRSDGGLVRLVTPLAFGEPEAAADARLASFLVALEPDLTRFFPD